MLSEVVTCNCVRNPVGHAESNPRPSKEGVSFYHVLRQLDQLCTDLSLSVYTPTLWGDNKSANLLTTNPVSSDRSKHIRDMHLRVRDAVEAEENAIDWIGTKFMLADGLTKVLPGPAVSDMRDKLHLVDVGPPRKPCGGVS